MKVGNIMKSNSREYLQPIGAMLELTSNCNLRCSHCYVSAGENNYKKELSDDQWLKLLKDLLDQGISSILLTGGEPLIKMDLVKKMINLLSKYPNVQINIASNGFLINEEFLKYFNKTPNKKLIQISIDGAYSELHDNVRKVKGSWHKAIQACVLISNYEIEFQIAHTVNKNNIYAINEIFELGAILGVGSLIIGAAVPLGRGYSDVDGIILSIEERKNLDILLENKKKEYSGIVQAYITSCGGDKYYTEFINYYQDWLLVKSDGNVKLENRLPFIVGNVKNMSINEIWTKLNSKQKSTRIISMINDCIINNKEIDNQEFIFI